MALEPIMLLLSSSLLFSQPDDRQSIEVATLRPRAVELKVDRDPITDNVSVYAHASGLDGQISVGCDRDTYRGVRVFFVSERFFKGESLLFRRQRMTHRFDAAAPIRSGWKVRNQTAVLRNPIAVNTFASSLARAERLVIRSKDIEGKTFDAIFLLGDKTAVNDMLAMCGQQ